MTRPGTNAKMALPVNQDLPTKDIDVFAPLVSLRRTVNKVRLKYSFLSACCGKVLFNTKLYSR